MRSSRKVTPGTVTFLPKRCRLYRAATSYQTLSLRANDVSINCAPLTGAQRRLPRWMRVTTRQMRVQYASAAKAMNFDCTLCAAVQSASVVRPIRIAQHYGDITAHNEHTKNARPISLKPMTSPHHQRSERSALILIVHKIAVN